MTYYDVLGVGATASKDAIRKAYLRLVQEFHPDKSPNVSPAVKKLVEEKFKDIQEAYDVLSKHRAEYDQHLQAVAPAPVNSPRPKATTPHSARQSAPTPTSPAPPSALRASRGWTPGLGALAVGAVMAWMNISGTKPSPTPASVPSVAVPAQTTVTEWQKRRDQISEESTGKASSNPLMTPFAKWQKGRNQISDESAARRRPIPSLAESKHAPQPDVFDKASQQESTDTPGPEPAVAADGAVASVRPDLTPGGSASPQRVCIKDTGFCTDAKSRSIPSNTPLSHIEANYVCIQGTTYCSDVKAASIPVVKPNDTPSHVDPNRVCIKGTTYCSDVR